MNFLKLNIKNIDFSHICYCTIFSFLQQCGTEDSFFAHTHNVSEIGGVKCFVYSICFGSYWPKYHCLDITCIKSKIHLHISAFMT